jgi:LysM repeat protein
MLALLRGAKRLIVWLKILAKQVRIFLSPLLKLPVNWLILRPYRLILRINRAVKKLGPNLPSLKLLSHHQSILYLLSIGALLITLNSWRVKQASAENFGQNTLLFPLIKPDFELIVSESDLGLIPENSLTDAPAESDQAAQAPLGLSGSGAAILKPHLVTSAPSAAARTAIEYYEVEEGDTLSSIADRFGLSINTLLWENRLTARSIIRPGQKLTILPTDGITYRIGRGDTVAKIAARYKVSPESILTYNKIASSALTVGQTIVIPGGRPLAAPVPVPRTTALTTITSPIPSSTRLLWPTAAKRITQYYTWRHGGIDIAGPIGTPIYAAEEGIVEVAGWNNGGYGYYIIIDHGGGLKTLYGHASKLLVAAGDRIARGEHIANVGSTGHSTGPHLHFEVRVRGRRTNPLNYIR